MSSRRSACIWVEVRAKAEQQFALLLRQAATKLDKARVYRLRSVQYETWSRYADSLTSAGNA